MSNSALPCILQEAHSAEVVVLVQRRRVGVREMAAGHAAQGAVGVARSAATRHGGRDQAIQSVVGVGHSGIPGGRT